MDRVPGGPAFRRWRRPPLLEQPAPRLGGWLPKKASIAGGFFLSARFRAAADMIGTR